MENEILYQYDLHQHWPEPSSEAVREEKVKKIISYTIVIILMFLISASSLGGSEIAFSIVIGIVGGITIMKDFSRPAKLFSPHHNHRENEVIEIDVNKIKWTQGQGFFRAKHSVHLNDIIGYQFKENTVQIKTKKRTYYIYGSKIVNTEKRAELFQLLKELSKRIS